MVTPLNPPFVHNPFNHLRFIGSFPILFTNILALLLAMSKKRRIPSDASSMTSGVKKSRLLDQDNDNSPFCSPQSKVDPTYGQRGVFPGLDDICQDNDLFYGPANDGLEYLRMVR